jgi:hypothetical protein
VDGLHQPHAPLVHSATAFYCPWVPLVPALGVAANLGLMINLDPLTWVRFLVWLVVGIAFYAGYGAWHSRLRLSGERGSGAHDAHPLLHGDDSAYVAWGGR